MFAGVFYAFPRIGLRQCVENQAKSKYGPKACHYWVLCGPWHQECEICGLARYLYRAWVTNLPLTPAGVWHFYDGRAGMEPRICELREDFAMRKIPTGVSPLTPCIWK